MTDQVITGHTRITFSDQLRASWTPRLQYTLATLVVILTTVNLWSYRDDLFGEGDLLPKLIELVVVTVPVLLIWPIILLVSVAICHRRMRKCGHLDVTYQIGPDMLVVSDATGIRIDIPWNLIKNAREDRRAFRLSLKVGGQRYYPKRSFSETDLPAVRAVIREKLGTEAKLRA